MSYLVNEMTSDLAVALETSEAEYWSKYYENNQSLKHASAEIAGAFMGTVPELDILALNRVIGLGMQEKVTPEQVDNIIRFFSEAGAKRFFIQLSPNIIQHDLKEILVKKGFQFHNNWTKLFRKTDQPIPTVYSELEVIQVSPSESRTYGQIIFKCFDWKDERLIDLLSSTVGKPGYKHYLALHNDQPVAAAALHVTGIYASMAFAGTLPDYRGMGGQSLLLKIRILEANKRGCKYLISETAEQKDDKLVASYRNMRKFGFEIAYLRENWIFEF